MKFWRGNRLDQEFEADPQEVVQQFVTAVREGYDLSHSRHSVEFAFRLWLTSETFNVCWDDVDDDQLMDALSTMSDEDKEFIWSKLVEGLPS